MSTSRRKLPTRRNLQPTKPEKPWIRPPSSSDETGEIKDLKAQLAKNDSDIFASKDSEVESLNCALSLLTLAKENIVTPSFAVADADDKTQDETEMEAQNDEEIAAMEQYDAKKTPDAATELIETQLSAQSILELAADGRKTNKKAAKKDPEAPMHPISAYLFFETGEREAITKKNSNSSSAEVSKLLRQDWQEPKGEKDGSKKYDWLAAKDKERYETERQEHGTIVAKRNADLEGEKRCRLKQEKEEALKPFKGTKESESAAFSTEENSKIKVKKKKDPNAPKKDRSAYLFFCNENRTKIKAEMTESTQKELYGEIGRQWRALSDSKKAKYKKMAEEDKSRYEKEVAEYVKN